MRKLYILLLLLIPSFSLCSWREDLWEEACYDGHVKIYNSTAHLWELDVPLLEVQVEPREGMEIFLPNYSRAEIAAREIPLIPTKPLHESYSAVNHTFFIPIPPDIQADYITLRIVGNNSLGCPTCGELTFPLPQSEYPEELPLNISAWFNSTLKKFMFRVKALGGVEDVAIYASVVNVKSQRVVELFRTSFPGGEHVYELPANFSSENVSAGVYALYIIGSKDVDGAHQRIIKVFSYFSFADMKLEIPELPKIYPGNSYELSLALTNIGTLTDTYQIEVLPPSGWEVSLSPTSFQLVTGESREMTLHFTVPELHQGPGTITLLITSSAGISREYRLEFYPEARVYLEANVEKPLEIKSYSENEVLFKVYSSGTVEPTIFWIAYTEPALSIDGGYGEGIAIRGVGNVFRSNMSVGGACSFSNADGTAFNAGRRVLVLAKAAYHLSENLNNDTLELINSIIEKVNKEKLLMTSENAVKLYDETDRVSTRLAELVDAYLYGSPLQVASRRESLYLEIVAYEQALRDTAMRMMEKCSKTDKVDLYIYMFVSDLGEEKVVKLAGIPVKGTAVIDLIGPAKLKAIAGTSTSVEYTLKNNAAQDFDVEFETTSDILIPPYTFIHLPAGTSKKVSFRIFPPEYMEERGLEVDIIVRAGVYELRFPVKVDVGRFYPEIVSESREIYVVPGREKSFNITVSTGGLDDTFTIHSQCPSWVSVPDSMKTEGGSGILTLLLSPPSELTRETYDCEIEIRSQSFPEMYDRKTFSIIASREAEELRSRLQTDRNLLELLKSRMKATQYAELERKLQEAENAILSGEYTRAKARLADVERTLRYIESQAEERKGINPLLILGLLIVAGFAVYRFLLPKLVTREPGAQRPGGVA